MRKSKPDPKADAAAAAAAAAAAEQAAQAKEARRANTNSVGVSNLFLFFLGLHTATGAGLNHASRACCEQA